MRQLVSIILCLQPACFTYSQSASFVCTNRSYEFGTITSTQQIRQVFTLCSSGSASLAITHIQACCGLTTKLASTNIPPGACATLDLTFIPGSYVGLVRKTVYLHTNDPEARIVAFRLSGTVVRAPPSGTPSPKPSALP
jgi:hypothetical protein